MKKLLTVIQVLLLCVCIGCGVYLVKYFYDSNKARTGFEELRREVTRKAGDDVSGAYEEQYTEEGTIARYESLYEKNNDFRGWLKIDGTAVDYPVVQGKDNDYYLHRDFYGNYQYSGIPFLDCDSGEDSLNLIIYAHNMKDGSMFASISNFEKKDFLAEHKIICYDTLYENGDYEIMSVFRTRTDTADAFRYYDYADLESEEEYVEYVARVKGLSVIETNVTAVYGDRLLTLSTCAYNAENERLVIVAHKI